MAARHAPDPDQWGACVCGERFDTAEHLGDHLHQARGDALARRLTRFEFATRPPRWRQVLRTLRD